MTGQITIIAGSRSVTDSETVESVIESAPFEITRVVSGGADGVDEIGEGWANQNEIPVERYLPEEFVEESGERGIPAPLVRNEKMASVADACIVVWDGESRGTMHMKRVAEDEGLEVFFRRIDMESLGSFV